MKNSQQISVRRILKGVGFFSVVFFTTPFVLLIAISSLNNLLSPKVEQKEVLGTNKYIDINNIPEDAWYKADEYLYEWDWDRTDKFSRFIDTPQYYFDKKIFTLEDSWVLKNGYRLDMKCKEIDMNTYIPGDSSTCELWYNGKMVVDTVRYEASLDMDTKTNLSGIVTFTIFSDRFDDDNTKEFLVTSQKASGSDDLISVFLLDSGNVKRMQFIKKDGEVLDSWYVRVFTFDMYDKDDSLEFVTYDYNPGYISGGVGAILYTWKEKDGNWVLDKTTTVLLK